MTAYLTKRLLVALAHPVRCLAGRGSPVLEILPGDAARIMLGTNGHRRTRSRRCAKSSTSTTRYRSAISSGSSGLLTLDFGRSYTYSVPVIDLCASGSQSRYRLR